MVFLASCILHVMPFRDIFFILLGDYVCFMACNIRISISSHFWCKISILCCFYTIKDTIIHVTDISIGKPTCVECFSARFLLLYTAFYCIWTSIQVYLDRYSSVYMFSLFLAALINGFIRLYKVHKGEPSS